MPLTDAQRVEEQATLLHWLEKGRRAGHTVQCMPDGCEVIHARTGELERKIALIDVSGRDATAIIETKARTAQLLDRVVKQAIERDNGLDRCKLCRREAHMGHPIRHHAGCVIATLRHEPSST